MRLYVMRHGPAEDRASSGRDFDRALTQPGRAVVERAARALHAARGAATLRVVSSPFRRASETAEVVARLVAGGAFELDDDLRADGDVPLRLVREVHAAGSDALLVGHQPIVEELVRALVMMGPQAAPNPGAPQPARPSLQGGFRTATIVTLEHASDRWHLCGVLDPHALAP